MRATFLGEPDAVLPGLRFDDLVALECQYIADESPILFIVLDDKHSLIRHGAPES